MSNAKLKQRGMGRTDAGDGAAREIFFGGGDSTCKRNEMGMSHYPLPSKPPPQSFVWNFTGYIMALNTFRGDSHLNIPTFKCIRKCNMTFFSLNFSLSPLSFLQRCFFNCQEVCEGVIRTRICCQDHKHQETLSSR